MIIKEWHEWSGIAVSISALLGESFVSYLLTNSNNIFRSFINSIFKIDVKNGIGLYLYRLVLHLTLVSL